MTDNNWHVIEDCDNGSRKFHPWLTEDHARRLAALMNEIETWRVEKHGLKREDGHGRFYSALPERGGGDE